MTTHQLRCASIYLKIILSKLYCKSLLSRSFAFLVLYFSPFTKNNHLWLIVLTNSHSPFSGCDLIMPHVFPTLLFTFVILPYLCHIIACFREDFLHCLMFLQIIICLSFVVLWPYYMVWTPLFIPAILPYTFELYYCLILMRLALSSLHVFCSESWVSFMAFKQHVFQNGWKSLTLFLLCQYENNLR